MKTRLAARQAKLSRRLWLTGRTGLLAVSLHMLLVVSGSGCQNQNDAAADRLNKQTKLETAKIDKAVDAALDHNHKADDKVIAATTQPGNPPQTNALLVDAHTEHQAVVTSLEPVAKSTVALNTISDKQAGVTHEATKELKKEQASFWSYRQRRDFYLLLLLLPLIGLVTFAAKVGGIGPIVSVIMETLASIWEAFVTLVKWAVKWIVTILTHIFTFGGSWLADRVNAKYTVTPPATVSKTVPVTLNPVPNVQTPPNP